jgi:hypothetical protein
MMKYYIPNININKIDTNNIRNLNKKFSNSKKINILLLSDQGFFKYIDDKLYKHSINYKQSFHVYDKFLNKYTLIASKNNEFFKHKYPINNIPFNHKSIIKTICTYKINDNSNTSLIIEFISDKNDINNINDLYFISNLNHDDFSFIEDISYFIDLLI